jgi:hypothetical protein
MLRKRERERERRGYPSSRSVDDNYVWLSLEELDESFGNYRGGVWVLKI